MMIYGVVLAPVDEGSGGPGGSWEPGRIVSGFGGSTFSSSLRRIIEGQRGKGRGFELEGWHYAAGVGTIRGGLVALDGAGYQFTARRLPSGIQLAVYTGGPGSIRRPVSRGVLSPDQMLVFRASVGGRSRLVVIGARWAGDERLNKAGTFEAHQTDFLAALDELSPSGTAPMRWVPAAQVEGLED